MNKLLIAAGIAVLSLSFAGWGYAVQADTNASGDPGQSSTSPSGMGSDRTSQHDSDAAVTDKSTKKRKSGESNLGIDKDRNTGKGQDSGKSAPKAGSEGSNPTLDKAGKGSATGG